MRKRILASSIAALLLAGPAFAIKNVVCHVQQVMHTRYGVLVLCAETFPDPIFKGVENINFFAPDARLNKNGNGIAPNLTVGETMLGFEGVAIEAFRSKRPLVVTFQEGSRPGGLFDCQSVNCRLVEAWSVSQ